MKKLAVILLLATILISCGNQKKTKVAEVSEPVQIITVDELYQEAEKLVDQEVTLKGTVMHVCKQGGGRCFLMGSTEDIIVRVEAGEKIGAFTQEQMGSELEISGIFRLVKTEADAHNPGKEHGEDAEEVEDASTEEAHQTIADSQEEQEAQYFIEGLSLKEI